MRAVHGLVFSSGWWAHAFSPIAWVGRVPIKSSGKHRGSGHCQYLMATGTPPKSCDGGGVRFAPPYLDRIKTTLNEQATTTYRACCEISLPRYQYFTLYGSGCPRDALNLPQVVVVASPLPAGGVTELPVATMREGAVIEKHVIANSHAWQRFK